MSVQYVCMSAGKVKCQFFFCFFSNRSNLSTNSMVAQKKKTEKCQFLWSMYVWPKLTFVSFFCFFCAPFPKSCRKSVAGCQRRRSSAGVQTQRALISTTQQFLMSKEFAVKKRQFRQLQFFHGIKYSNQDMKCFRLSIN